MEAAKIVRGNNNTIFQFLLPLQEEDALKMPQSYWKVGMKRDEKRCKEKKIFMFFCSLDAHNAKNCDLCQIYEDVKFSNKKSENDYQNELPLPPLLPFFLTLRTYKESNLNVRLFLLLTRLFSLFLFDNLPQRNSSPSLHTAFAAREISPTT